MASNVGSIDFDLRILTNGAMDSLRQLEAQVIQLQKSIEKVNKTSLAMDKPVEAEVEPTVKQSALNNAFNVMQAYFGARTIEAIVRISTDAAEIDYQALQGKIAGEMTDVEFKNFRANLDNVSMRSITDIDKVVAAANDALSNDVSKEDIDIVMDLAGKLKVSNFSDIESAAGVLISLKNALDLDTGDLAQVADMLTKGNYDLGKVSLEAMNSGLEKNASLLQSGAVSLAEYIAMGEVLTSSGIGDAESQTFIGAFVNNVAQASDSTKKWAQEVLDLDFSLRHMKNVGVDQFIREIQEKTGGNEDYLAKLFGNLRGSKAFDSMISKADALTQSIENLGNSSGYLNEVFGELQEDPFYNYEASMQSLKSSLRDFGNAMAPIITVFAQGFSVIAEIVSAIPEPVMQLVGTLMLLAAASVIVNSVLGMFSSIGTAVNGAFAGMTASASGLSGGMLAAGGAILGLVVKLLVLPYCLAIVAKNWNDLWNSMLTCFHLVASGIVEIFSWLIGAIEWAVNGIIKLVQSAINAVVSGVNAIIRAGKSSGNEAISGLFKGTNEWNKVDFSGATGYSVAGKISGYSDKLLNKAVGYAAKTDIDLNLFDDFEQNLQSQLDGIDLEGAGLSDKLINGLQGTIDDTKGIADELGNSLGNNVSSGANKGSTGIKKVDTNLDNLNETAEDSKKTWDDLKDSLEEVADSFNDVSSTFEQMAYKVVNASDVLKSAAYNLQLTNQFANVRDKLLNNSNLNGYALNYVAGLDAGNIGELKALASMSSSELASWNYMMNSMDRINTTTAGQTVIVNNNYEINRVANEKDIVNYIQRIGKKQGWS